MRVKACALTCVFLSTATVLINAPAVADSGSVAERCPVYRAHLERARGFLAAADQNSALGELREARKALGDCVRDEVERAGEPIMLAAESAALTRPQGGRSLAP